MAKIYELGHKVEDYILNKDKERIKGHRIGPSEISSPCIRQIVWNRSLEKVKAAEPESVKGIGRLMLGSAIHEYFQTNVLPNIDDFTVVECERHIEGEFVNGYIDVVIQFKDDGRYALLELKTAEKAKFQKMFETGTPLTEHVEQLVFYEGYTGIHEGYLFVINKEMFSKDDENDRACEAIAPNTKLPMFLSIPVPFDEHLYKELTERAKNYVKAIADFNKDGTEPVLPEKAQKYNPNGFPCLWCRFRCLCHENSYKRRKFSSLDMFTNEKVKTRFKSYMKSALNHTKSLAALNDEETAMRKMFYGFGSKGISEVEGDNYLITINDGAVKIIKKEDGKELPEKIQTNTKLFKDKEPQREHNTSIQTTLFPDEVKEEEYISMIFKGDNFITVSQEGV